MSKKVFFVVPCFNEEQRLNLSDYRDFAASLRRTAAIIFVDDGSTDSTPAILDSFADAHSWACVIHLPKNRGKAEAVRLGLREAIDQGAEIVGFFDADLATPPQEIVQLLHILKSNPLVAVLGSRIRMLGTNIERFAHRHALGRIFAVVTSHILKMPIYDSQCGAKIFSVTEALKNSLARPFLSRWAFDVELLGRLAIALQHKGQNPLELLLEVPLRRWRDTQGSKVRPWDYFFIAKDLFFIWRFLIAERERTPPRKVIRTISKSNILKAG